MTEQLRELERAVAAEPGDKLALERLQDERVRRGLGWHGEEVPRGVRIVRAERGVYAKPIRVPPLGPMLGGPVVEVQLVYVPGGEVACECCRGTGHVSTLLRDDRPCPECSSSEDRHAPMKERRLGTGKHKIAPFYVGRFPVIAHEFMAFPRPQPPRDPSINWGPPTVRDVTNHPITDVSLEDARAFCSWAGLRLPSEAEWQWAALGAPRLCGCAKDEHGKPVKPLLHCEDCRGRGAFSVRFPWGNEPPSQERCVWSGHPEFGPSGPRDDLVIEPGMIFGMRPGSTAPVIVKKVTKNGHVHALHFEDDPFGAEANPRRVMVPAREGGKSWCGAHDMFGNVWEFVSDGARPTAMGGSFMSLEHELGAAWSPGAASRNDPLTSASHIGFRVALSA